MEFKRTHDAARRTPHTSRKCTVSHPLIHATHTLDLPAHARFSVICSTGGKWEIPTPSTQPTPDFQGFLRQLDTTKTFMPNPRNFNAQVLEQRSFGERRKIGDLELRWASSKPADGVVLDQHESGLYTAAGCPVIIAAYDSNLAFAHAGQRCLFDTMLVLSDKPSREHSSVVAALLQKVAPQTKDRHKAHLWVYWSIAPSLLSHDLKHPTHGSFNEALVTYLTTRGYPEGRKSVWWRTKTHVHLNLPRIIKTQATETCHVPHRNVHIGEFSYLPRSLPTTRTAPGQNYIVAVVRH